VPGLGGVGLFENRTRGEVGDGGDVTSCQLSIPLESPAEFAIGDEYIWRCTYWLAELIHSNYEV
jgi:hypothetical protein